MDRAEDILPPHSGRAEIALAEGVIRAFDIDIPIRHLMSASTAPAAVLPWLAWHLSVDEWNPDWLVPKKREAIAQSVLRHARKGTVWAVREMLRFEGYGDAVITEMGSVPKIGDSDILVGGARIPSGSWVIGPDGYGWADYWIDLMQPVPRWSATRLRERLREVAPARCRLRTITLAGEFYTIGDGLWLIGDDVAIGNIYIYEED
ncbi:phage tail protein I [Paracoccus sp. DMF-8]|uniref:phage tail protein I n=1 Tax=Paracoccus sp. DMF-8 TaxID=3019445 RepID=UPI0023E86CBD|nr:phage tail protein I [Paracoccus sp. DMF-8]MDF3606564.1 phage tail protein I [Paracoccus sp. DMF-8]